MGQRDHLQKLVLQTAFRLSSHRIISALPLILRIIHFTRHDRIEALKSCALALHGYVTFAAEQQKGEFIEALLTQKSAVFRQAAESLIATEEKDVLQQLAKT